MATALNDFLTKIGEGVKPNMFAVDINWPQGLANKPILVRKSFNAVAILLYLLFIVIIYRLLR